MGCLVHLILIKTTLTQKMEQAPLVHEVTNLKPNIYHFEEKNGITYIALSQADCV